MRRRGYDTMPLARSAAQIWFRLEEQKQHNPVGFTVEQVAEGDTWLVRITYNNGRVRDFFPLPLVAA